jgi:hypothetical protein
MNGVEDCFVNRTPSERTRYRRGLNAGGDPKGDHPASFLHPKIIPTFIIMSMNKDSAPKRNRGTGLLVESEGKRPAGSE